MKVLIFADNHFSQYSSIIRRRGEYFSKRLENQIQSINWLEQLALDKGCTRVVCLGDFFDKENLNSEELSALNEIKWSHNLEHYFLVGNHEMGLSNLQYNSAKVFNMVKYCQTISSPQYFPYSNMLFIPYDLKSSDKSLKDYFADIDYFKHNAIPKNLIIFSHNDIKGIQYGKYLSQGGFDLDDIEQNCALFINGHLHNGTYLNSKKTILNLGNLTGQNFSEDAFKHSHNVCIIDTDTLDVELIENPYAFNFYKLDFSGAERADILIKLQSLKSNAVVSIKVYDKDVTLVRDIVSNSSNIVESRIIIEPEVTEGSSKSVEELVKLNHIEQFNNYILNALGTDKLVLEELEAINVN